MKSSVTSVFASVLVLLLAACSTTDSRISERQAAFNSLRPEDQARIRNGQVDVGFTEEMVLMALGEPARRYSRTTERGTMDIWAYRSKAPAISLGFGVGGGSGRTGMGGGIGVTTGGDQSDDRIRVVFENRQVTAIERAAR